MRACTRFGCAALLALAGCSSVVRRDLSEDQATEIVVALDNAAIAARLHQDPSAAGHGPRYRVEVPASEATAAMRVLRDQGLPRAEPPGVDALYADRGLLATPDEERARFAAATGGELAQTLRRMPGVRDARVHLSLPSPLQPLDAPKATAKASVLLVLEPAARADEREIRKLVAAAVHGLNPDAVDIVTSLAPRVTAHPPRAAQVGPISVRSESAPWLRGMLALALCLALVSACALLWALRRKRSLEAQVAAQL